MSQQRRSRGRRVAARAVRAVRRRSGASRPVDPPPEQTVPPAAPLSPREKLLVQSPLFDDAWYAHQTGQERGRLAAVRHYLAKGRAQGLLPHPLFDPGFFSERLSDQTRDQLGDGDPLSFYLRRRYFRVRTHPLFETGAYLRRVPEAREHPAGPVGHYCEIGAPAGLPANEWLAPLDGVEVQGDQDLRFPDLRDWLRARRDEWTARRDALPRVWRPEHDAAAADTYVEAHRDRLPAATGDAPLVSVVLAAGVREEELEPTLESLAAQTLDSFEVVVIDRGVIRDLAGLLHRRLPGVATRWVTVHDGETAAGFAEALRTTSGEYVAFLDSGDTWVPDRLRLVVGALLDGDVLVAADGLRFEDKHGRFTYSMQGHPLGRVTTRRAVDLARVVVRRDVLHSLGAPDTSLQGAWAFDLVVRLAARTPFTLAPVVGVHRFVGRRAHAQREERRMRPPVQHEFIESWNDVVLNNHLVDWSALAARTQEPRTVSVIIPTYDDYALTEAAVRSVMASDGVGEITVDCIVVDNGSTPHVATVLDSLPARFPGMRLVHSGVNHGFALGNNIALPLARGATVMFLNNDTTVPDDWLVPVVRALEDPSVLGAQSLLVYPTGAVQSAGVAFPTTGGLPHALLAGFPVEDAAAVDDLRLRALTGAALAARFDDVVRLRGFDPVFTNGLEDVDLCHRLSSLREGWFRVVSEAPVTHYESRTAGRYEHYMRNRSLYLDRWAGVDEPRDDAALWAAAGYRLLGHEVVRSAPSHERRLCVPMPTLVRQARLRVDESPQSLRWAIKIAAPAGPVGGQWGDTHFAHALASALRTLGQDVVIDRCGEFERASSRHDDVSLLLRGLVPFRPSFENINLAWVISHPEMVSRREVSEYDRVFAASATWATETSRRWGVRIDPLLQATDPAQFHPDRAVPDTGHPVIFVGGSRKVYRPIVRDAVETGLPLSVYGSLWERFIPRRFVKGEYLDNRELSGAYRSAGVVLNDHWEDMREQGFVSNRLFDAAASGARVITDDVHGLNGLFGDSVQVYRTPEDLVRLSSLADPDEVFGSDTARRAVAERLSREHSFAARAERLVEVALHERRRRGFTA